MPDTRPSLAEKLGKLGARLRARGPGEIATLARDRLRQAWSSEDVLIVFSRSAEGDAPEVEGLLFRPARPSDGNAYARDIGTDSGSTFARRLSPKTFCYLVFMEDKIVHASWVTLAAAWTRELRSYLRPPPGDAYVYESFTRSEVRGRGVYPYALRHICSHLGGLGTERVWVAVEEDNLPSSKAIAKAGFKESFRISYRRQRGALHIEEIGAEPGHTWVAKSP